MPDNDLMEKGRDTNAASRLADYLRRHPHAVNEPAEVLAQDAGVPLDVVRRVRGRVMAPPPMETRRRRDAEARPAFATLRSWWSAMRTHGVLTIGISSLLGVLVVIFAGSEGQSLTANAGEARFSIAETGVTALFLMTMALHGALYFARGRGKFVLQGSAAAYAGSLVLALYLSISGEVQGTGSRLGDFALASLAFFFVTALYALFMMMASVAGSLYQVRMERIGKDRLTRQELLERLFDIQERLEQPQEEVAVKKSWHNHPIAKEIEGGIFVWTAVLGLGVSLIMVLTGGVIVGRFGQDPESIAYGLTLGVMGLMSLVVQVGLAFLSRTVKRAVLVSLLYGLMSQLPTLLPIGGFGVETVMKNGQAALLSNVLGSLFLGLLAGLGATIEGRATHQRLMRANDPVALLAEYVDIQQRLNPGPREVTVMVVDAAKSSVMKSIADPYIAEWSFRAYQQLLERAAFEFMGEVMSTAGDGAVITFDDPNQALACAHAIQRKIAEFNEKTNKLSMPFQLRIGLHKGTVVGQIDKVQYTDVIDIAAHVEAACCVGGIAVSERVWNAIPGLRGEAIAMLVDGFVVYQLERDPE